MYLVTASWKADIVQSNICFVISSNNTLKSNPEGEARVQLNLSTNPVPIGWITCKNTRQVASISYLFHVQDTSYVLLQTRPRISAVA